MSSTLPPVHKRPVSYSESHIYLPRFSEPLLQLQESRSNVSLDGLTLSRSCPSPPTTPTPSSPPLSPSPTLSPAHPPSTRNLTATAHRWAIRFTLHLVLISLFETIFFWQFVSKSEDSALTGLVDSYAHGVLAACQNITPQQRVAVDSIFDLFINQTTVDTAGAVAAATRASYNGALIRNSWLYFGGLCGLFASLSASAVALKREIRWGHIVGENLVLVSLLGLYEWMFFHTIIYQYESISPAELDRMVVDEFQATC
jgi:hypothetical protein